MLDIQYRGGNIIIRSRDKDGKRTVTTDRNFHPYFFIPEESEYWGDDNSSVEEGKKYISLEGRYAKKLICKNDRTRQIKARKFKSLSWEADVHPETRYLLDNYDELPDVEPRIVILDIEVDSSVTFPGADEANYAITCATCHDSFTDKYTTFVWRKDVKVQTKRNYGATIKYFNDEKKMVTALLKHLVKLDFDIMTGWNVDRYDMQYIINRCKKLDIDSSILSPYRQVEYDEEFDHAKILGRHIIDGLATYEKLIFWTGARTSRKESRSLDAVSEKYLGDRKKKSKYSMAEQWTKALEDLIEYNVHDVRLVKKIMNKFRFIEILDRLRHLCVAPWSIIDFNSLLLDMYMLRFAHRKKNLVLPTKIYGRERQKYEGAVVYTPPSGIFKNVAVLDLASMYPSIMIQFNLSPEKIEHEGKYNINGIRFSEDVGFATEIIDTLMTKRLEYKKIVKETTNPEKKQQADFNQINHKLLINSFYGAMAYPNFRLYKPEIASSVTYVGRRLLQWSREIAEKHDYRVLYGDTDSIFVKLKNNDSVLDEGFELERLINESYNDFAKQFGADKNEKLEISFEKLYSTCIFVGVKKRYIGRVIWKGSPTVDMDSTGFESRRKDTPPWAHDCLVTFYNMLLDGKDKKIILDFIKSKIKELNNVTVADVGITQRFGKDISDYTKNMPMHVRGAKYSIEHLNQQFSRLDYGKIVFISKVPVGYPHTDVITLKENTSLPDGFELDKKRIFKRLIEMKIKDLIGLIGLDVDEIFGQTKLEAWFNE